MHQLSELLPQLRSERLILRAMADGDAAALLAIYGDPLVMQYTDEAPFPDLATVQIMLASVRRLRASGESLEWAIILRETDELIGTCGLHSFDDAQAEVGCLLRRTAWANGYMAEAIALLTQYATDVLQLRALRADVASANERARRLFGKLGYEADDAKLLRSVLR